MVIEESKNLHKPIIDFLRAFAVLAVLINHLNNVYLPNGKNIQKKVLFHITIFKGFNSVFLLEEAKNVLDIELDL